MSAAVTAALITGSSTVFVAILTGAAVLWRLGRDRRYERRTRHLREFQDRSGELREANREYGRDVSERTRKAAAAKKEGIIGAGTATDANFGPGASRQTDSRQAVAYDRVRIAATRVESATLVRLNEYWRQLSQYNGMSPAEVSSDEENRAWDWFNQACVQASTSRTGLLKDKQSRAWDRTLDEAKSSVDDTDAGLR